VIEDCKEIFGRNWKIEAMKRQGRRGLIQEAKA
jgi:hypothetical protein